jgi:hypothetical protein
VALKRKETRLKPRLYQLHPCSWTQCMQICQENQKKYKTA